MARIKLSAVTEDPNITKVVDAESRESRESCESCVKVVDDLEQTVVTKTHKTSEARRRAIKRYEEKNKRINCRIPEKLWAQMEATGESANSTILKALELYFDQKS